MRCCTVEYLQRLEDIAAAAAGLIQLRIGNTVECLGYNYQSGRGRMTFQWKIQVDLEPQEVNKSLTDASLPDIVEKVRFGLKPACKLVSYGSIAVSKVEREMPAPAYAEIRNPPFEITATSWIPFTIPIVIIWKDWVKQPPLRLEHHLDFNLDGGFWSYGVEIAEHFRPSHDNATNGSTVTSGRGSSTGPLEGNRTVWSKAKALMPRARMKLPKLF